MFVLSAAGAAALAIFAGLWLGAALWLAVRAGGTVAAARGQEREIRRQAALLAAAPALPVIVAADGSLQAPERLAWLLGLSAPPVSLQDIAAGGAALPDEEGALLEQRVGEARRGGASSSMVLRPVGSGRTLSVEIGPAPPPYRAGAVTLWVLDITAQEAAANARAAEADRRAAALDALSGLIEAAPFPIWHRGADRQLALVNSAYVAAVDGRDAAQVVGEGVELVDEPDRLTAVEAGGGAIRRSVTATIAGERRMIELVELPIGPAGVAGFAIDVEEQEQARAELGRFLEAQRDMLDRLSAGVAQFGRDRALTFFNQPFARLFDLTPDFLADRPEFDRVIDAMRDTRKLPEPRDFPSWKAERRGWFTGGLAAIEEDWELPDRRHLRVLAQPLPDGGLLVVFEDRTRQIMLESDRERMIQVQTTTFDNLAEGIAVFASNRRLKLWNNRFRTLWALAPGDLTDRPLVEELTSNLGKLVRRPRQAMLVRDLVRAAITTRRPRTGRLSLSDGREYELAAIPIPADDVLFTTLDVTDSHRVETALRERTLALEEADRVKTAFVSNISYELRTPLTSIAGFAEMLDGGYAGELPEPAREYVGAILTSVGRLSALIDNILDLTQSDTGSLLLAEEDIDLIELAEAVAEEGRKLAGAKTIRLSASLYPSVGQITGDRRRLQEAIGNLVRNAVQFTPADGQITIAADGSEDSARIVVADTGAGIALADQTRVFDRFQRSAERRDGGAHPAPGMGLGLPLAKQFVEAHGGSITLRSEPGVGSEFTIILPRTAEQRAAYRAAADGQAAEPA
jgi:signal transduction histidine kinase